MIVRMWLAILALLATPVPAATPPAAAVQAHIETITYPVHQVPAEGGYAYLKANPNLAGKEPYATDAIVLENEYVRAVVLPEFGARLPRVTFKTANRDLFWVNDVLEDNLPWAMGGLRVSFPFPEYGRHMDEGAGWRIVKGPDGSVTVGMDMRFSQYAGEVQQYGRFSGLRHAVYVTLRPGTSVLEYSARIDSRLPLAHGFRLWSVAQFPRRPGANILFPTPLATGPDAAAMQRWPTWDDTDHSVLGSWNAAVFAVDMQGDWSGVYYPDADANHLVLKPRFTVLGTGLRVGSGASNSMIEMWHGSNPTLEHPGHFLPPFGNYVLPLKLTMVTGIGRVEWANNNVAVSYEAEDQGARIRVAAFQVRPGCTVMARTKAETAKAVGTLSPDRPLVVDLAKRAEPVLLTVVQGEDEELAEVSLPWRAEPTPPETFPTLVREMRPWGPPAMELSDWPRGDSPNIADAAKALADGLSVNRPAAVLAAARVAMRTETPGSPRWRAVRGAVETIVNRKERNRHAEEYLGMMMLLESRGTPGTGAAKHLAKAEKLSGAAYLLGLDAIAGAPIKAAALLARSVETAPPVAMGLGDDAIDGGDRMHPAAMLHGQWPTMVRAAVLLGMDRPQSAVTILEQLLTQDPARPEAMALLAEAYSKAKQPDKAMAAKADADRLFQFNDQARRDYEMLLEEARKGVWSGIPKP
jgi:hypothetical protein